MRTPTDPPGCGPHAGLGAELRAVAVLAMERIGPVLDRVRAEPDGGPGRGAEGCPGGTGGAGTSGRSGAAASGAGGRPDGAAPSAGESRDGAGSSRSRGPRSAGTCAVCPICAVVAVLRGERPELAVRLAEHAAGLLAVLHAALHEGDPGAWPTPPSAAEPAPPSRRVQHIRVERPAAAR